MKQDELRKQVRLARACNEDIYYKHFAAYLDMTEQSFYNWLNGSYDISAENVKKLKSVVIDLID